ncbi:uncharacterized protein LOC111913831 [Lactuca sativa]|uniref:uncharacterized protein LOC111913831 n=1 Tax=Lactuca sativa TaxID=4236 RepID=UPI0022AF18F7|nr:uncharacterized protein LOC111913831 [Lactuca sativa]
MLIGGRLVGVADHVKAKCPLFASNPVQSLAPGTLHIIDGRQGQVEAAKARGRVFQLTAEEARITPNVVVGTFLVSSVTALMLIDSGVSRSVVSTSFCTNFSVAREALDQPLTVAIADDRMISASEIYQDCVLEIFGVGFPIDLIIIAMGDVYMITCMDWLSWFGALNNCEKKLVMVHDPSRGVLTTYGEGTRVGYDLCSIVRMRRHLHHGCMRYLTYVVDPRAEGKQSVSYVLIVRDFLDIISHDFLGVPPER